MDWKAKISLLSIFMVPLLLLTAVSIWIFKPFQVTLPSQSDSFLKQAPQLGPGGHLLLPNLVDATIVAPNRPHDPNEMKIDEQFSKVTRRRAFQVSTNKQGFRSPELGEKTRFRILCIGESVTFGWGVKAEESYPARLGVELGAEVINAGVPAMKPKHMAAWMKGNARSFEPDLILLTARPDWMQPNPWESFIGSLHQAQHLARPIPVALVLPPISSFDPRGRSTLEEENKQLAGRLPNLPYLDLTPIFDKAKGDEGVDLVIEDGMQKMVERKTGALIASGPNPSGAPGTPALAEEITQAFEDDLDLKEALIFDGAHPDEEGNRLFAAEVAKWIQMQGWTD
jgi:lysophospholipase L1-like esterase